MYVYIYLYDRCILCKCKDVCMFMYLLFLSLSRFQKTVSTINGEQLWKIRNTLYIFKMGILYTCLNLKTQGLKWSNLHLFIGIGCLEFKMESKFILSVCLSLSLDSRKQYRQLMVSNSEKSGIHCISSRWVSSIHV